MSDRNMSWKPGFARAVTSALALLLFPPVLLGGYWIMDYPLNGQTFAPLSTISPNGKGPWALAPYTVVVLNADDSVVSQHHGVCNRAPPYYWSHTFQPPAGGGWLPTGEGWAVELFADGQMYAYADIRIQGTP